MIQRQSNFSAHIVQFCRFLRSHGFKIGPGEECDALQSLGVVPIGEPIYMKQALQAVLCKNLSQVNKFDELYTQYWHELSRAEDSKIKDKASEGSSSKPKQQAPSLQELKNWLYGKKNQEEEELATYSPGSVSGSKKFAGINKDEFHELMQIIRLIADSLALKKSRRFVTDTRGDVDLRKSIRQSLRAGGELWSLAYKQPKVRKLKLVLLCDVSKSMDLYSRFLIQFMYAFQQTDRDIETFIFSTQLQRISPQLKNKNINRVMETLSEEVHEWSGGTRIGASLYSFITEYSSRMLDQRTIVMILSDGWDTGEIELLSESMSYIHRKAAKIIWLNPLAGSPDYKAEVRGMSAALPYIDIFAPVHNLESLRAISQGLRNKKRVLYD